MMVSLQLYKNYGPILNELECSDILKESMIVLKENNSIEFNFESVVAIPTIGAKMIFGSIYRTIGGLEFAKRVKIVNTSNIIQHIIYDAIIDSVSNEVETKVSDRS